MNIKIGDYQIVSDERQFVVKAAKKVTDKESENYGKDYMQNVAYCTSFDSALRFIPQQVLKSNDDITAIKEKLNQIQADIKALPNPIKIEVEKVVVKKEKVSDGKQVTISKKEYELLKRKEFKLECLDNGGVDNWEWYEESLKPYCQKYED